MHAHAPRCATMRATLTTTLAKKGSRRRYGRARSRPAARPHNPWQREGARQRPRIPICIHRVFCRKTLSVRGAYESHLRAGSMSLHTVLLDPGAGARDRRQLRRCGRSCCALPACLCELHPRAALELTRFLHSPRRGSSIPRRRSRSGYRSGNSSFSTFRYPVLSHSCKNLR